MNLDVLIKNGNGGYNDQFPLSIPPLISNHYQVINNKRVYHNLKTAMFGTLF